VADDRLGILWLVLLLLGNAFFVGAEFAVISAKRSQIEPRAEAGSRAARTTLYAMEHATLMLATSQLGITVCSLMILNVAEPAIHHLLEAPLHAVGLSDDVVAPGAFILTLAIVSYLHVVFGEMVPKNLSFSVPDRAALLLAPPLVFISRVLSPVIRALNWLANLGLRAFRVEPKDEATSAFTFDEVATIVEQSKREGLLDDAAGTLGNAFEFTTKRVGEVAIDAQRVVTLPHGATPADLQRAVAEYGFSRYIVRDVAGAFAGYVHIKDLLDLDSPSEFRARIPRSRIRPLASLSTAAELEEALATMRATGTHVARAFDERDETVGVLFLEDIIEELVGEVEDASRRDEKRAEWG